MTDTTAQPCTIVYTLELIAFLAPIEIRELLAREVISIDLVRELPHAKFMQVFPNTQASQQGLLHHRPDVPQAAYRKVLKRRKSK